MSQEKIRQHLNTLIVVTLAANILSFAGSLFAAS